MGLDFFLIVETWNGYDQPASLIPNGCFRFKKLSAEELIISYWKSTVFILFFNGKRILLLIKIGIEECSRYNSVTFKLLFRNLCFFYLEKNMYWHLRRLDGVQSTIHQDKYAGVFFFCCSFLYFLFLSFSILFRGSDYRKRFR